MIPYFVLQNVRWFLTLFYVRADVNSWVRVSHEFRKHWTQRTKIIPWYVICINDVFCSSEVLERIVFHIIIMKFHNDFKYEVYLLFGFFVWTLIRNINFAPGRVFLTIIFLPESSFIYRWFKNCLQIKKIITDTLSYLCTKSVIQNIFYDYIINLSVIDHKIYFILKSIVKWSFIITICHFLDNAHFKFFEQAIEGCIRGII